MNCVSKRAFSSVPVEGQSLYVMRVAYLLRGRERLLRCTGAWNACPSERA